MEGYMLCRQPGKCCPMLAKKGRRFLISDKGQNVYFTKEQLKVLGEVIPTVL